jgi:hypothetical protein
MLNLVLIGFSLLTAQEPDRSTPEKVFEGYMAAWDKERVAEQKWGEGVWAIDKRSAFYRTDKVKARVAAHYARGEKMWKDGAILSTKFVVVSKSEEKDGVVTVEGREEVRQNDRPQVDGPLVVIEFKLPHRLVLEKAGSGWVIREIFNGCTLCHGTGLCSSCKGTGKVILPAFADQPEKVLDCIVCEKHKKNCSICLGKKLNKLEPGRPGWGYILAEKDPEDAKDLSSPGATAKAIVDVLLREKLDFSKDTREQNDSEFAALKPYLNAAAVKAWKDLEDARVAEGLKKFATARAKIEKIEEKGDSAFVVIVEPPYWRYNDQESKTRYVLKKTGTQWLVDAEQFPCVCEKPKECDSCKGSGWYDPASD